MRTTEKTKCVKMGSTFLPLARLLFTGQTNHFSMIKKNNCPFDRIPFCPVDTYTPGAVIFRNKVKFDESTEERMLYFLSV